LKELEQRKKRIEAELNQIHQNLDNSFNKAKTSLVSLADPSGHIRRKPLHSLAIAVIAGFAIGYLKSQKKNNKTPSSEVQSPQWAPKPGIANLLFDEVRRMAARKAAVYLMDFLDTTISRPSNININKTKKTGQHN